MASSVTLHSYPPAVRLVLGLVGLGLIIGSTSVITALSRPSQFVTASQQAALKPAQTTDLKNLNVLDFTHHLYLYGSIIPAGGPAGRPLFDPEGRPALAPATFSDVAGAVEVLAPSLPLTAEPPQTYHFNEPLHLLGWRTSENGFTMFAVAKSQQALQDLLRQKSGQWRKTVFGQGLLLVIMIFAIFWLLNLSVLSTPMLRAEQLFLVNLVFLVLYYSVLALSGYPLLATVPQTLLILALANLVFVPLALIFHPHHAGQEHTEKEK